MEKLVYEGQTCIFDIYIHVDKKVKNFDFLFFRTYVKKAHIEFTKKRINVRWGGTDTGISGTSFV